MVESGELPGGGHLSQTVSNVARYHGKDLAGLDIDDGVRRNIELVSAIDRVQNSCLGAPFYLEREKGDDAKHYKVDYEMNNPGASEDEVNSAMTGVSDDVLEHYKKGELFDKVKSCKTYADYFLFAILLGINCLKSEDPQISDLAKQCYLLPLQDDKTALDLYRGIIQQHVDAKYSDEAIRILEGYVNPEAQAETPIV